jgi:hypothetical protein
LKPPETQQDSSSTAYVESESEKQLAVSLEGLNLASDLMLQLLDASDRVQLQEVYFKDFHPHWPLLHKETFLRSTQPTELTSAVLAAGLWVLGTLETRDRAQLCHDALMRVLHEQLARHPAQVMPLLSNNAI